jgi:hypothetical protein
LSGLLPNLPGFFGACLCSTGSKGAVRVVDLMLEVLGLLANAVNWVVFLVSTYIFSDFSDLLWFAGFAVAATVIYGAFMAAIWMAAFLADRRSSIALKDLNRKGR